jgi:hypothetical protein
MIRKAKLQKLIGEWRRRCWKMPS